MAISALLLCLLVFTASASLAQAPVPTDSCDLLVSNDIVGASISAAPALSSVGFVLLVGVLLGVGLLALRRRPGLILLTVVLTLGGLSQAQAPEDSKVIRPLPGERDFSPAEQSIVAATIASCQPGCESVSDATIVYNAHGRLFDGAESWIEGRNVQAILTSDYLPVSSPPYVKGDIVVYRAGGSIVYTALVREVQGTDTIVEVEGKWGSAGVCRHAPLAVPPRYGTQFEIWREADAPEPASIPFLVDIDRPAGSVGTSFTFDITGLDPSDAVASVKWSFQDGQILDGTPVTRSFTAAGLITGTVTVTTLDGRTQTADFTVTVFPDLAQAPAEFQAPDLLGDVNGDGSITLADALLIAQHASRLSLLSGKSLLAADVDLSLVANLDDALLISQAALANGIANILLPPKAGPGATVTLISTELLDPDAVFEIEVGASNLVQKPLRVARGYLSFLVPLDPTTAGSREVTPGPVDVRLLKDGVVVATTQLDLQAPAPPSADAQAELAAFLDELRDLLALNEELLREELSRLGIDAESAGVLLAMMQTARLEGESAFRQLERLIQLDPKFAELFLVLAKANGFDEVRQQLIDLLNGGLDTEPFGAANGLSGADACTTVLPTVCRIQKISAVIQNVSGIVTAACDAAVILAAAAILLPEPVLDIPAVLLAAKVCVSVTTALDFADLIWEIVGTVDADFRLDASPRSLKPGQTATLTPVLQLVGLDDVCSIAGGAAGEKLIEEKIANRLYARVIKRVPVAALAQIFAKLGEKYFVAFNEAILRQIGEVVGQAGISDAIGALVAKLPFCAPGVDLTVDAQQVLSRPMPDVGTLSFATDGTAQYMCPGLGGADPAPPSVAFDATKDICGKVTKRHVEIQCGQRAVTITMGDNGTANDDIYEVRIGGQTVLTSSVPVRSTSTTVQLPVGDTQVQMIGRAAPDGIGTYFIQFTIEPGGSLAVSGAPTSGTDLTPGVVKTFVVTVL